MKFFFNFKKSLPRHLSLTADEQTLLASLSIVETLGTTIKNKTQNKIEGLYESQMFDDYESEPKLRGIKSLVDVKVSVPTMLQIVRALQADKSFLDYHILSCGHFSNNEHHFIIAIKTIDKFECLRIFETNGINYNIETNHIIDFLKKWEAKARFSIIEVDHDCVTIQLKDFNFDMDDFCKQALEFCPDFSAAVENEKELKKYIVNRNGEVDFWWD